MCKVLHKETNVYNIYYTHGFIFTAKEYGVIAMVIDEAHVSMN